MKRIAVSVLTLSSIVLNGWAQQSQTAPPFTIDQLMKVRRVADPQLSPDGRLIAYTITDTDFDANRRTTQIYVIPSEGGPPKQITTDNQSSSSPRWSPDGRRLAFVSMIDGVPQILTIDPRSGERRPVTNMSSGTDGPVWSPDGKLIAFTSQVYPECSDDECNRQRDEKAAASKVKARIIDSLLYRHWNFWRDGKRTHVFVVPSDGGTARDLTPGDHDAPPFSLGGPPDYAFSPDSLELAFARKTDKVEALSTNGDIFIVPVGGGEPRRITGNNPANDLSPVYSPDGRYIAYRAQSKAGFESDRWRLMLFDRKTNQSQAVADRLDSSVESIIFSPDGLKIFMTAAERGRQPVYETSTSGAPVKRLIAEGVNDDVKVTPDGAALIFTRQTLAKPIEIFRSVSDGSGVKQLTTTNDAFLAQFQLNRAEDVEWEGAGGAKIHGFVVKPANFTPSRRWPLIVLIHGGPQGAWSEAWSYRWNPQIFAAAGYVVFAPNPRGSTGYGQAFVDEISGEWAGKVHTDIMNGVAHLAAMPYIDGTMVGAAGGSYGGYMVNWIEGNNDDPRVKFKALVSHAGVFNLTSMYGATEELWFPEWEFKGTPWSNPKMYERWSPHLRVKDFSTPMLVIHGELDYRVPVAEGFQLFTALQRQGVESRLLYYPDEGHWVLKPQNSKLWYDTVLGWFDDHLKPKADN